MKIWKRMWLLAAIGCAATGAGCTETVDPSSPSATTTETSTMSSATSSTTTSSTDVTAWEGPAECTEGQEAHLLSGVVGEYLPWSTTRMVLALTAKLVFYSSATDPSKPGDQSIAILRVPKGGGGANVLGTIDADRPAMIAVAERLYHADVSIAYDEYNGDTSTPELHDVPVSGDAPAPIVDPHAPSAYLFPPWPRMARTCSGRPTETACSTCIDCLSGAVPRTWRPCRIWRRTTSTGSRRTMARCTSSWTERSAALRPRTRRPRKWGSQT